MDDYKGNSYKGKANENAADKKVEKIVSGKVITKKKSEVNKFKDVFISEDAGSVKNYILMDVLVPAIKKAVKDIVTDGIEMILYGSVGNRSKSNSSVPYVSYDRFSNQRDNRRIAEPRSRVNYDYRDIALENRGEAEEVLSSMDDLINSYGMVSVADLYDMVGVTCNYTDNKYGWTNLRGAEVVRVSDGYLLKLPRAVPI